MKGLRILLESMGIKIDPAEIEKAWGESKDALPRLAMAFQQMNERQARLETKLDWIMSQYETRNAKTYTADSPTVTSEKQIGTQEVLG